MLFQIAWLIPVSLVIGAGVFLALRHPILAASLSSGIAIGLLALWLVASILGLLAPKQQGPESNPAARETTAHRLSAHIAVIAAWMTLWWTVPVSAVRGIRKRAFWRMTLEISSAFAVVIFVLLSSFTGYLNTSGTSAGYLRFRVLHTIGAPILGMVAVLVFCALMERARRSVRRAQAKEIAG